MQLSLQLFGADRLRPAVEDYLATQCYEIAEATVGDYGERARWLYGVLGEWRELRDITYPALVRVIRVHGPDGRGLKYVTLKKRLVFLRAVIEHAHNMGLCPPPPKLPRLPDDGNRGKIVHTRAQFAAFRMTLAPGGKHRTLAELAYWTGMHTYDLFRMTRADLSLSFDWNVEGHIGAFMRKNHKNKHCEPTWFPLEAEALPVMRDILERTRPGPDALLLGRVWNIGKTFAKACDRAEVPRISPIRLRASMGSRLLADGYPHEYVRLALGHIGEVKSDGRAAPSTTLSKHYACMSADVIRMAPKSAPTQPPEAPPAKPGGESIH